MTTEPETGEPPPEPPRLLDKPGNVKGVLWGFLGACIAIVGYEIYRPLGSSVTLEDGGEAVHHLAERAASLEFVGSFALYGFVSCVALVIMGKGLRRLTMRSEDFYDPDDAKTSDGDQKPGDEAT